MKMLGQAGILMSLSTYTQVYIFQNITLYFIMLYAKNILKMYVNIKGKV